MARRGFSSSLVTTSVDARELRRAMSQLPKDIQNQIRDENLQNARGLANAIEREISPMDPPQAELVKASIRPVRDRNVRVDVGGVKKVGRPYKSRTGKGMYRAPAGALVYGAEYGSSGKSRDRKGRAMGKRFVRSRNADGYFINPATKQYTPRLLADWKRTIQSRINRKGLK